MEGWDTVAKPDARVLRVKAEPECRSPKHAAKIWQPTKATGARELARSLGEKLGAHSVKKEVNRLLTFSFDGLMNYVSGLESALSNPSRMGSFKQLVDHLYSVLEVVDQKAVQLGNKAQTILKRCQSIARTLEEATS